MTDPTCLLATTRKLRNSTDHPKYLKRDPTKYQKVLKPQHPVSGYVTIVGGWDPRIIPKTSSVLWEEQNQVSLSILSSSKVHAVQLSLAPSRPSVESWYQWAESRAVVCIVYCSLL